MNLQAFFVALFLCAAEAEKLSAKGLEIAEVVGAELHLRERRSPDQSAEVDAILIEEKFPTVTANDHNEIVEGWTPDTFPDNEDNNHEIKEVGRAKRAVDDSVSSAKKCTLVPNNPLSISNQPTPISRGQAWLDSCGTTQPFIPIWLRAGIPFPLGRVLHHSAAYCPFKNEYLVAFDYDYDFDGVPDEVWVSRRKAECKRNVDSGTLEITVNGVKGAQGWPSVTYNRKDRVFFIAFRILYKGTYIVASQRISVESTVLRRFGNPAISFYVKDSEGVPHDAGIPHVLSTKDGYMMAVTLFYKPTSRVFSVCLDSTGRAKGQSVVFGDKSANFTLPRLEYDPIEDNVYVTAIGDKAAMNTPEIVIKPKIKDTDELILVASKRTMDCKPVHMTFPAVESSDYLVVVGSTNQKSPYSRAILNVPINMLVVAWDRHNDSAIRFNHVQITKTRVFIGGEETVLSSMEANLLHHPVPFYHPSLKIVLFFWEEKRGDHWFIGGSLMLAGSMGMFTPANHQSFPEVVFFEKSEKAYIFWRNHGPRSVKLFGQCLCESERNVPEKIVSIAQCNSLFWIPTVQNGQLSAAQVGSIPTSAPIDFSIKHGKMVWYENYGIHVSSIREPNKTFTVVSNLASDPGVLVADWQCGMLYFTNPEERTVEVARLDQEDVRKVIATDVDPDTLAVNDGPDQEKTLVTSEGGNIDLILLGSEEDSYTFANVSETFGDKLDLLDDNTFVINSAKVGTNEKGEKTLHWVAKNKKNGRQNIEAKVLPLNLESNVVISTSTEKRKKKRKNEKAKKFDMSSKAEINDIQPGEKGTTVALKDGSLLELKNDLSTLTPVREKMCVNSKLAYEELSAKEIANPCCCNNGGCGPEQICFPAGNGRVTCDCRDGYVVVGKECKVPGFCNLKCPDQEAAVANICWKKDARGKQFIVMGTPKSKKEIKNRLRYTLENARILQAPKSVHTLESFNMKKRLHVWLKKPGCCLLENIDIGTKQIFVGTVQKKENGKVYLYLSDKENGGQVINSSGNLKKIKQQLPCVSALL